MLTATSASSAPRAAPGGAPPETSATTAETEADAAFRRGEELWRQRRRTEALNEFERAYRLSPAYEVLYFIGALSVELEHWARARGAFELYLQLGAERIEPEQLAAVRQHLRVLGERTATLSLTSNVPDTEVHVDGNKLESTTISGLVVDSGEHTVRVSKPGFRSVERRVQASDGENVHLVVPLAPLGLEPPDTAPVVGSPRAQGAGLPSDVIAEPGTGLWLPWTITGVLGTGWVTTALLAAQARLDRNTIERPGTSAGRIDDARRLHIALAVASDVLLISTLASGGVSAYLTWWQPIAATPAGTGPTGARSWALNVSGHF